MKRREYRKEDLKPMAIRVPKEIHKSIKVFCAHEDMSYTELIERSITEYLKNSNVQIDFSKGPQKKQAVI